MRLPKDLLSGSYTKPDIFLCETDKTKICGLTSNKFHGIFKFNSYSEINFEVDRTILDMVSGEQYVNPYYNKIEALRLLYVPNFGYFEIQEPNINSEGIHEKKEISAYSYEYTLSQKYLENFVINSPDNEMNIGGGSPSSTDYEPPVLFYNLSDTHHSLLHLILEKAYGWSIGHVDEQLKSQVRSFEIDRQSIYDFLVDDVSNTFKCYFDFDTISNTINVYAETASTKFIGDGITNSFTLPQVYTDLGHVFINGYQTTNYSYNSSTGTIIFGTAPAINAVIEVEDGSLNQWNTDVFISFENLASQMNISYSADDIKTKISVSGSDGMGITDINNGLPYIMDLSYYHTPDWMGQDLYDAYANYLRVVESNGREYTSLISDVRSLINNRDKLMDRNSLTDEPRLNAEKLNYFKQMLQIYYRNGTIEGTFDGSSLNIIDKISSDFSFVGSSLNTYLSLLNNGGTSIDSVESSTLSILSIIWEEYGSILLDTQIQAYKNIQNEQINAGYSTLDSENYFLYWSNYLLLSSCERAFALRSADVDAINVSIANIQTRMSEIADNISFENNFTQAQLIRLNAFIREDEYQDGNFIITDIDSDNEILQAETELLHCAQVELHALSQPRLAFKMNMVNVYALPEFEPIIPQFQLGNIIRVSLRPDYIKRSRLMEVEINFEDLGDFLSTFGDLLSAKSQADIHADLLKQAVTAGKSVANNGSKWQKATAKVNSIDTKLENGLISATNSIKSQDGTQATEWDNYGIHLRKYDPNNPSGYDDKQGWIVNNQFLYSSDGFKTSEAVFGNFEIPNDSGGTDSIWGVLAKAVIAGLVEGSHIKGGTIQIGERDDGTYNLEINENGQIFLRGGSGSTQIPDSQPINIADSIQNISEQLNNVRPDHQYRVEINTVDRNIMTQLGQTATLTCTVYDWSNDITDTIDSVNFNWKRKSNDNEADTAWNSNPNHMGRKTITINSNDDILNNANFICEVNI